MGKYHTSPDKDKMFLIYDFMSDNTQQCSMQEVFFFLNQPAVSEIQLHTGS